jgi:heme/copper-type cytochrome/quinol oxidase subunit 3
MSEYAAGDYVPTSGDYSVVEQEPPELMGRNLASAGHMLASASAFFFLAFVFAYFYLRSLNNSNLWHPPHIAPSQAFGAAIMACTVISAVLVRLGVVDQRAGRRPQWRLKGAVALAFGLAAAVLQIVEWPSLSWGPTHGGYASVFYGWTAFNLLFIAGTLYWLESVVATAFRYRNVSSDEPAPGHASGDPHRHAHDIANPLLLIRPGLEALSFFWSFLAGLGVLMWVVLYLI